VSDTIDALTTNRPYQHAHDAKDALRIIHSLSGKRLDPAAVAALTAIYERGEIRVQRLSVAVPALAAAAASTSDSAIPESSPAVSVAIGQTAQS